VKSSSTGAGAAYQKNGKYNEAILQLKERPPDHPKFAPRCTRSRAIAQVLSATSMRELSAAVELSPQREARADLAQLSRPRRMEAR